MRWLLLYLLLFSFPAVAALDCRWPFKTQVTVTAPAVLPDDGDGNPSVLTNYQSRIDIASSNLFGGYDWSNDGRDLRVFDSDDSTALDFWVDSWNPTTKRATIWVRFPTLSSGNRSIYLYYGNRNVSPITQVPPVFTRPGIRFHTRRTSYDPNNYSNAVSEFNRIADTPNNGYGCSFITDFTDVTNRSANNSTQEKNFIARSESFFEVKAGETSGPWEFRYGADFGHGGGLYVDGVALEEQWDDDLWWNGNWNDPDEILQGSTTLQPGYHKLEVIGAEPGDDGGITVQFKKPGGNWTTFDTDDIDIRSAACPVQTNISFGTHTVCRAELELMAFGAAGNNSKAPTFWVEGSPRAVTYKVRNNGDKPTLPGTRLDITIPGNLSLNTSALNGWSCTFSNPANCSYSMSVNSGDFFPDITFNVTATSSSPSPATLSATLTGLQYDAILSNNTRTISLTVEDPIRPPVRDSSCILAPRVKASFYTGTAGFPLNRTTFINNYTDGNEDRSKLLGSTLLTTINTSGKNNNPFNPLNPVDPVKDELYATIIDGYIYLDQDGEYEFAVNGDDAVEFELFSYDGTSYIASWYGGHGASHNRPYDATQNPPGLDNDYNTISSLLPVDITNKIFARGYYRFRFRHQENNGNDSYTLFWRKPGSGTGAGSFPPVPDTNLFHCSRSDGVVLTSQLSVINDPINSSNFKAIPGANIQYTVTAQNLGNISSDLNSTVLEQAIDEGSEFLFGSLSFTDGSGNESSGLTLPATITYLNAAGVSITPTSGYDPLVRKIRMSFSGTFKPRFYNIEAPPGEPIPQFSYQYQVRLQ